MAEWLLIVLYTALVWWCNIPSTYGMSTNEMDRLALLAFKAAIDDQASFGALSSWNDSVHYCDWNGILCSRWYHDRIVQLNLTSRGLVGSLTPHIGNLSFLRIIIFRTIPSMAQSQRRSVVYFAFKFYNSATTRLVVEYLSRCSQLEALVLVNNHLSGNIPSQLSSLSKLQGLFIGKNKFLGTIPPSIGNLSSLQVLSFPECNLHGEIPEGIAKLWQLTYLVFADNKLSGKVPFGLYNISTFAVFSLQFSRLQGSIPPDIGSKLPHLWFLFFHNNAFTGMIPNSLSNASGLETMSFGLNNFIGPMPKDLGELFNFQYMNFQINQLEDDLTFISSLTNCTRLQYLLVGRNLLRGSLPKSITNLSIELSVIAIGGINYMEVSLRPLS